MKNILSVCAVFWGLASTKSQNKALNSRRLESAAILFYGKTGHNLPAYHLNRQNRKFVLRHIGTLLESFGSIYRIA